ncbi:MAG TPA: phospholipase A [Burkholderiales bacterium]|nr:phospholipase A [Burkholderiales bacterium]
MKCFALGACLLAAAALAQEPQWLLVAPQRVVAGQRFEVIVVAPPGEALPDELTLRAQIDIVELLIPARAAGEPQGVRRRYAATMPARAGGPATLALAEHDSNAIALVVARSDAVQRLAGREQTSEEPPLSEEDPVYFALGAHQGANGRFQLSFKYRLFDPSTGFGAERPWLVGFYFGYTQTSLWDLSAESKPFRDTAYRPSFYWKWQRFDEHTWIDGARVGFEHESNGQGGDTSRSINTLFVRPEWRWSVGRGGTLEFTPKIYTYLSSHENPDIARYRGYVDWRVRHDAGGQWITTAVARLGTTGRGSLLLDMSRRTRDVRVGPLSGYLHLQYFNGYGESILDYNVRRPWQLRVGLAIVP